MTDKVIFFDGHCVLCNGFVDFLIKRDKKNELMFASLQSEHAEKVLSKFKLAPESLSNPESVIYLRDGETKFRSEAAIYIISDIGGIFSLSKVLILIPKLLRDAAYTLIARNRYSIFGKNASCRLPNLEEMCKFID